MCFNKHSRPNSPHIYGYFALAEHNVPSRFYSLVFTTQNMGIDTKSHLVGWISVFNQAIVNLFEPFQKFLSGFSESYYSYTSSALNPSIYARRER